MAAPARAITESLTGKLLFADILKNIGQVRLGSLKIHLLASSPVTSSGMFTPSVVFGILPAPIVRMDDYAGRGRIGVILVDMPTIAVGVADDLRGRG